MLSYITEIQRQLISKYKVPTNELGLPVPLDGIYPMKIDGKVDHVEIKKGYIHCLNFKKKVRSK